MMKRLFSLLVALLLVAGAAPSAWAALAGLGDPITPHGYPAWYSDSNGLQLELCTPAPAGNASRADLCIGDPLELNPGGTPVNPLVLTGEGFYWMAVATIQLASGGSASIEFAIESTFGGTEAPVPGGQITFGRTRIRIDTPVAGTYNITHPYSNVPVVFQIDPGTEGDGINMTADIGSANFLNPALAFRGTLNTPIGPFLTWENYSANPALQVRATAEGPVLEQYVGDPNNPSPVVGSPFGNNFFRVVGPEGSNLGGPGINTVETDLFAVMGKVNDPADDGNLYTYDNQQVPNLFAVGPVNRNAFFTTPTTATLAETFSELYSLGYPLWYQENVGTVEAPDGGLQLTLCPPGDAMCISEPIIPTNPAHTELMTGGEGFWYYAAATFDVGEDSYTIEYALESTFGGAEAMVDGNQISFARERIGFDFREDKTAATYRVTHPYGVRILEPQPDRLDRVGFTADTGIADLADPDGAFVGALYGIVGPRFLTWDTFVDPATLGPEALGANYPVPELVTLNPETGLYSYFVGNHTIPHTVTGGPNGATFRVERLVSGTVENGQWLLIGETDLWAVSGKIYDPATFEFPASILTPKAIDDEAVLNLAQQLSITIPILDNDNPASGGLVTINILPVGGAFGPDGGTAVVANQAAGTVTYTPNAAFAATGGVDTFAYNFVDSTGVPSNNAIVTVTVIPVETIAFSQSRFDLRRLRLDLRGTSNFEGSTLTFYPGNAATGTPLGTAVVRNGRWSYRGTATSNLTQVTVVSNSAGATSVTQRLQVR